MNISPIAIFHSPLTSKFGAPRQSGLAGSLRGDIVFQPEYRHEEAIRGIEGFSHLWLIWEFSANRRSGTSLTVRPPRLGGNERVGIFASRSPFRPNGLGLSVVRISAIDRSRTDGPVITVEGADLIDGTPIYDIKPYVAYSDSIADARSGFVDTHEWEPLEVVIPDEVAALFSPADLQALREVLSLDPRPRFHDDAARIYGLPFAGRDVKFRVEGRILIVMAAPKQA